MLGWVIAGTLLFACVALKYFWEDIAHWLNNTAADAVERRFGIDARKNMQRAVCKVSRIMDRLDNVARVFVKSDRAGYMKQIDLHATAPVYEQYEDVLREIEREGVLKNEFTFNG